MNDERTHQDGVDTDGTPALMKEEHIVYLSKKIREFVTTLMYEKVRGAHCSYAERHAKTSNFRTDLKSIKSVPLTQPERYH